MPLHYSINAHSAENDSDGESFSDELSPIDGYFNPNEMPTHVFVRDPSVEVENCPVEAKTLISPPGTQASTRANSANHLDGPRMSPSHISHSYASPTSGYIASVSPMSSVSSHDSHRRQPSFSEHTHNPPPPYSTTPSPNPPSSQLFTPMSLSNRNYSTIQVEHLEQGFIPPREPADMGGRGDDPNEITPLVIEGQRYSPRRRKIKNLLFVALVFTVIVTIVSVAFGWKLSTRPKAPRPPVENFPPLQSNPVDLNMPNCPSINYEMNQEIYEFSAGRELTVIQETHGADDSTGRARVSTHGKIHLRRIPKDSKHGSKPYITLDIGTSGPMHNVYTWTQEDQKLRLSTPKYAERGTAGPQCLFIEIIAWFPEDAEFTNLLFESVSLPIGVFEDVKIKVTGHSKFASVSGDIWFPPAYQSTSAEGSHRVSSRLAAIPKMLESTNLDPQSPAIISLNPFSSRRTVVETVSGSISGVYLLLDDLLVSSQSGDVKIIVVPQPASKSAPAPADLEVQTASGTIQVNLPIKHIEHGKWPPPSRDYITRVHSTSGTVSGTYYLGSETSFKTTSGAIDITALPILPNSDSEETKRIQLNSFETHTVSGSTKVLVLDPIFFSLPSSDETAQHQSDDPVEDDDSDLIAPLTPSSSPEVSMEKKSLRDLRSHHTSTSAQVSVQYPDAWRGSIHAKTVTGDIEVKGEGFRTVKDRKGWAFREVLKRRGVDGGGQGCFVEMGTVSGDLSFKVR